MKVRTTFLIVAIIIIAILISLLFSNAVVEGATGSNVNAGAKVVTVTPVTPVTAGSTIGILPLTCEPGYNFANGKCNKTTSVDPKCPEKYTLVNGKCTTKTLPPICNGGWIDPNPKSHGTTYSCAKPPNQGKYAPTKHGSCPGNLRNNNGVFCK